MAFLGKVEAPDPEFNATRIQYQKLADNRGKWLQLIGPMFKHYSPLRLANCMPGQQAFNLVGTLITQSTASRKISL